MHRCHNGMSTFVSLKKHQSVDISSFDSNTVDGQIKQTRRVQRLHFLDVFYTDKHLNWMFFSPTVGSSKTVHVLKQTKVSTWQEAFRPQDTNLYDVSFRDSGINPAEIMEEPHA